MMGNQDQVRRSLGLVAKGLLVANDPGSNDLVPPYSVIGQHPVGDGVIRGAVVAGHKLA